MSNESEHDPLSMVKSAVDATLEERQSAQRVRSGVVAEIEDALRDPESYEITLSMLGWTLRHVESDFCTLISDQQAFLFYSEMSKVRLGYQQSTAHASDAINT
jgi:hypothetical protein